MPTRKDQTTIKFGSFPGHHTTDTGVTTTDQTVSTSAAPPPNLTKRAVPSEDWASTGEPESGSESKYDVPLEDMFTSENMAEKPSMEQVGV